ncbi:MAG TPA: hypothetical protein VN602_11530, partial [Gemmatimonadaceae bacterium]|nr:hypothetical protein [Gemmatimonadaceae bacterium]
GLIVGLLLDARIQHATNGRKSLDDMMRLAYKRYGGAHGFTPQQWVATASDVAGSDLTTFFHTLLQTTDEMDYSEALDWFGLRFAPSDNPATAWTLEIRPDATPEQTAHLDRLTQPYTMRSRTVGSSPMMRERPTNQGALKVLVSD